MPVQLPIDVQTVKTSINQNKDYKTFELSCGKIINNFLFFKNLGISENLGFGLQREHGRNPNVIKTLRHVEIELYVH